MEKGKERYIIEIKYLDGNEDLITKEEWDSLLSEFNIIESYDIQKLWSNSFSRKLVEVFLRLLKIDIRQKVMYYCKVSAG